MTVMMDTETDLRLRPGIVERGADGAWRVRVEGLTLSARPAFSCLVAPRVGDRVLVAAPAPTSAPSPGGDRAEDAVSAEFASTEGLHLSAEARILAILDRPAATGEVTTSATSAPSAGEAPALELVAPGDLTLRSKTGTVHVVGDAEVALAAPRLRLLASRTQWLSERAEVSLGGLRYAGDFLKAEVGRLTWRATEVRATAARVFHTIGRWVRRVTESEEARSKRVHQEVETLYQVESQYTLMTSKSVTRIDGEQIQMG